MTTLQILCPNGRRQNVKINPNTKLLQVLEEVCQKQKFLPAEEFKLVHGRTSLDLTLSVRYANLANNAKLELVKAEKSRAESEVVIALQLEGGTRLQHAFPPATTLWDLLLHWENTPDSPHAGVLTKVDTSVSPATQPVVIYMREEVVGEAALRQTQLRTLGLTGGKAALRLAHRPVDEKTLSEILAKIEKDKQKKIKLERSASQTSAGASTQSSTTEASVQTPLADTAAGPTGSQSIKTEATNISFNINVNIQSDQTLQTGSKVADADSKVADSAKVVADSNASKDSKAKAQAGPDIRAWPNQAEEEPKPKVGRMEKPDGGLEPMEVEHEGEPTDVAMETEDAGKTRPEPDSTSTLEDPAVARRRAQREAAESLRAMNIPGVEIFTPDDFNELTPEQQQVAQKLAEAIMPRLGLMGRGQGQQVAKAITGGAKKKQQNKQQSYSEFKFPEATKGKKLYDNDLSEVKRQDFKPCDRQTIIYSVDENILPDSSAIDTDLPDEFFELTEADIKGMMVSHQKQLDSMENQPLMTSAMRQARLESAYSRYDRVVIRVHFHDKLVLQGCFRPRETVFAIQKFVKEYLEDKSLPFHLYTSPPKCVLKDSSQTLLEARLVPATKVYFSCDKQQDHYLSEAVLSEVRPRIEAEQIIAQCLGKYEDPGPVPKDPSGKGKQPVPRRAAAGNPGPSTSGEPFTSSQSDSKPVPKWFKIGKK